MCNLFRTKADRAAIARLFRAKPIPGEHAPEASQAGSALVVRDTADTGLVLRPMRWGILAGEARSPVTLTGPQSATFRKSANSDPPRRCIVPMFEFSISRPGDPISAIPWFSMPSHPVFGVAGIWQSSRSGPRFAIMICEANTLLASFGAKSMPAILDERDHDRWLHAPAENLTTLIPPQPAQLFAATPDKAMILDLVPLSAGAEAIVFSARDGVGPLDISVAPERWRALKTMQSPGTMSKDGHGRAVKILERLAGELKPVETPSGRRVVMVE